MLQAEIGQILVCKARVKDLLGTDGVDSAVLECDSVSEETIAETRPEVLESAVWRAPTLYDSSVLGKAAERAFLAVQCFQEAVVAWTASGTPPAAAQQGDECSSADALARPNGLVESEGGRKLASGGSVPGLTAPAPSKAQRKKVRKKRTNGAKHN